MELQKHQKFNFNVRFYLVANLYFFLEDIIYKDCELKSDEPVTYLNS